MVCCVLLFVALSVGSLQANSSANEPWCSPDLQPAGALSCLLIFHLFSICFQSSMRLALQINAVHLPAAVLGAFRPGKAMPCIRAIISKGKT